MTITVRIYESELTAQAKGHHVHMNLAVLGKLRTAGIPVDGVLELRGVTHGRLTMHNEIAEGERTLCYEWVPDEHSPAAARRKHERQNVQATIDLDDV